MDGYQVELRLPSSLLTSEAIDREQQAASKIAASWARRSNNRRFALDTLAFRPGQLPDQRAAIDPPELHAGLRPAEIRQWLKANPPFRPQTSKMRQDLPDFEHGKPRKNPKRKAPDTAAAVASEESEPKRRIVQEHDMSKSTTIDNPQPEPVEEELPYMPDRFLFYFLKPPYRLASAEAERGSMSTKVNPAAIMATLIPEGSEYLSPLQHGYWAIPVSPSLPDQVKVHPAVSSIAWSHFNPSLPHSSSSPRTLEWSYKRLKTFWHRMSAASKNFGGIVLDCHFLDDREEMRLYCSGRRALLWRKLLDTLKLDGAGKEDSERWFKGVGLVWRAQNGKAVLVA